MIYYLIVEPNKNFDCLWQNEKITNMQRTRCAHGDASGSWYRMI